jgi:hypothetical protein
MRFPRLNNRFSKFCADAHQCGTCVPDIETGFHGNDLGVSIAFGVDGMAENLSGNKINGLMRLRSRAKLS